MVIAYGRNIDLGLRLSLVHLYLDHRSSFPHTYTIVHIPVDNFSCYPVRFFVLFDEPDFLLCEAVDESAIICVITYFEFVGENKGAEHCALRAESEPPEAQPRVSRLPYSLLTASLPCKYALRFDWMVPPTT